MRNGFQIDCAGTVDNGLTKQPRVCALLRLVKVQPVKMRPDGKDAGRTGMLSAAIKKFLRDDSGNNAVEYGLIAALISIAIVVSVTMYADKTHQLYVVIADKFPTF